jgi:putative membrane protein
MWWNMHGWSAGGWWTVFGFLWMLLFWGGIIGLAVWGINRMTRGRDREGTPLEIAQRRYASGEITRDEFESIKAALTGGANPATGQGRG